jgi:ferrous iron transport protein A
MVSLDQLRVGQRACIQAVTDAGAVTQRLLEMGLLEDEEIEVIGVAPLGDPVEIRLRDFRLSLRRREAACVSVRLLEEKGVTES